MAEQENEGQKQKEEKGAEEEVEKAEEEGPAPLGLTNTGHQFCGNPAALPQELCHPPGDRLSTGLLETLRALKCMSESPGPKTDNCIEFRESVPKGSC